MKKRFLTKVTRRMFRKGHPGQTIIILAIAFIVLLGFVGLVTDISLLFVRYNTLRRAVDSAAVAAAGQMRRFTPTAAETAQAVAATSDPTKQKLLADGYALARNITTLNLAARQFVEFYGMNPSVVLVDTCATLPSDPALECTDTTKLPRKLVRVTAQVDSPTVFLRLLGWRTVKLEASAVSETATMDVVLVFDASESMANQTSYADWEAIGKDIHYYAPRMAQPPSANFLAAAANGPYDTVANRKYAGNWQQAWVTVLGLTQAALNADTAGFPIIGYRADVNNNITFASSSDAKNTRQECRVRFFPSAQSFPTRIPDGTGYSNTADDIRIEYGKVLVAAGAAPSGSSFAATYDGFAPAYNYFGCCNDPDGNGDFSDLICQPFLKMRQATATFLDHIDFARGDRVAFVTFDRNAYIIDPDGKKGGPTGTGPQDIMITSQPDALNALTKIVGVRSEPSYYSDTDNNGLWDAFTLGGGTYDPNSPATGGGTPFRYNQQMSNVTTGTWTATGVGGFDNTTLGLLNDYPVKDNCRLQNALLPWPFSKYSSPINLSTATAFGVPYVAMRYPTPLAPLILPNPEAPAPYLMPSPINPATTMMNPNLNDPNWDSQMSKWPQVNTAGNDYTRQKQKPYFAYEYAAGCAGSNVGAALRVGNNAFLQANPARSSGSVWVMVMLGDGAAAGSDPVRRNGATLIGGNPYGDPNLAPYQTSQYGAYGLCPFGSGPTDRGELVKDWETDTPRCMDKDITNSNVAPTRHLCFNPKYTDGVNYYVELNERSSCTTSYDVDDFARDWADFIGLADPFPELTTSGSSGVRSALQLPVIFTIGFGLDFQQGTHNQADNLDDYLGEELLRYIADVGDNQRLDSDYEQDLKADGFMDWKLTGGDASYGDRGPCENTVVGYTNADAAAAVGNFGAIINPMNPRINCGNYYNAPGGPELERVFDDIASRLFTRLTR